MPDAARDSSGGAPPLAREHYSGGYCYRQTIVERDGSVVQSMWLDAERVALWLHAVLIQGRRPRRLVLQRIRAVAPDGHIRTLYDSAGQLDG